jgi:L-asparaginase/Glu-tRNA(Gln) amidotransferase subunit D
MAIRIFATGGAFDNTDHKTIVLTGAMVPYAFGSSDGLFNLGSALSFVQALPPGVYVGMNGRAFPWECGPEGPRIRRVRKHLTPSHERTPSLQPSAVRDHLSRANGTS